MSRNIDLTNGGDSHKRWDIYPGKNESHAEFIEYLLDLFAEGDRVTTAKKVLALPSANGMPKDVERSLKRVVAGVPVREEPGEADDA